MKFSGFRNSYSVFELEFIIGDHTAVKVKAKESISGGDLKPLNMLAEGKKLKNHICVRLEQRIHRKGDIVILPYRDFLSFLWSGKYR